MHRTAFPPLRRWLAGATVVLALGASTGAAPIKIYAAGSLSGAMAALIEASGQPRRPPVEG